VEAWGRPGATGALRAHAYVVARVQQPGDQFPGGDLAPRGRRGPRSAPDSAQGGVATAGGLVDESCDENDEAEYRGDENYCF